MATSAVNYRKIPLGDDGSGFVTAAVIDRIQQRIQEMAQSIPVPASPSVVSVNSDYSVNGTEDVLHVDAQAGPVKITLLHPNSAIRPLVIKQVNLQNGKSKVNQVTVSSPDGSKTIAGAASYALDLSGTGSVGLSSDGQQHWPSAGAGGNPPVSPTPAPVPPFVPPVPPPPPPPPPITPWIAPVPYGTNNTYISNTLGTETWGAECMVDFTQAPGALTAWLWLESQDSGGSGTIRIRVGGSANKALDGVVVALINETSIPIAAHSLSSPCTVPAGAQPMRVTISTQSTAGQKCIASGVNLQFR